MDSSVFRDYLKKLNFFSLSTTSAGSVGTEKPTVSTAPIQKNKKPMNFFASDMVIEGSLYSESDVRIEGRIHGDIVCKGNVEISGTIEGNIEGLNVMISNAEVTGNIKATESVFSTASTVTGDINTQTADINSSITGNIAATRMLVIRRSAAIRGNISAASITIEENAILDGSVCVYQEN